MSTLLSIDPGRSSIGKKTIGYSIWVYDRPENLPPRELVRDEMSFEDLVYRLRIRHSEPRTFLTFDSWRIHMVLVEDFVNNAKSRGGQTNGASECIGAIEILSLQSGTSFFRQRPDALAAARLHAPEGSFADLKHLRHEDSAYLHALEFLVRRGDYDVNLSATM